MCMFFTFFSSFAVFEIDEISEKTARTNLAIEINCFGGSRALASLTP